MRVLVTGVQDSSGPTLRRPFSARGSKSGRSMISPPAVSRTSAPSSDILSSGSGRQRHGLGAGQRTRRAMRPRVPSRRRRRRQIRPREPASLADHEHPRHRGRARGVCRARQQGDGVLEQRGLRQGHHGSVLRRRRPRDGPDAQAALVVRLRQGGRRVPRPGVLAAAAAARRSSFGASTRAVRVRPACTAW